MDRKRNYLTVLLIAIKIVEAAMCGSSSEDKNAENCELENQREKLLPSKEEINIGKETHNVEIEACRRNSLGEESEKYDFSRYNSIYRKKIENDNEDLIFIKNLAARSIEDQSVLMKSPVLQIKREDFSYKTAVIISSITPKPTNKPLGIYIMQHNEILEKTNKTAMRSRDVVKAAIKNRIDVSKNIDFVYFLIDAMILDICKDGANKEHRDSIFARLVDKKIVQFRDSKDKDVYFIALDKKRFETCMLNIKEHLDLLKKTINEEKKENTVSSKANSLERISNAIINDLIKNRVSSRKMQSYNMILQRIEKLRKNSIGVLNMIIESIVEQDSIIYYERHSENIRVILEDLISRIMDLCKSYSVSRNSFWEPMNDKTIEKERDIIFEEMFNKVDCYMSSNTDLKYLNRTDVSNRKIKQVIELIIRIRIQMHKYLVADKLQNQRTLVENYLKDNSLDTLLSSFEQFENVDVFSNMVSNIKKVFTMDGQNSKIAVKEGSVVFEIIYSIYKDISTINSVKRIVEDFNAPSEVWENPVFYHCSLSSSKGPKHKAFIVFRKEDGKLCKKEVKNSIKNLIAFYRIEHADEFEHINKQSKEVTEEDLAELEKGNFPVCLDKKGCSCCIL